ncbi:carA2 [Symbiodinium pilosum]|uniref:CarA2 protein n=1 Tax=Symbiodinium pilosum TaxID=2952 RepID=A0A812N563_SYMPI|nr:carA2 [Symbiodinium pilosum]
MLARRCFLVHLLPLAWLLRVHADSSCERHEVPRGNALLSVKAETARNVIETLETETVHDIFEGLKDPSANISSASNTSWGQVNESLQDLVNNVLLADINQTQNLPDPEGNYSDPQNRTGLGRLAQSLEFLYLKVAELETAVELQNIELQLAHQQAQLEIQGLKDRLDQKDAALRQLQAKLRQHAAEPAHHDADAALLDDRPPPMQQRHRKAWLDKGPERQQRQRQRMGEKERLELQPTTADRCRKAGQLFKNDRWSKSGPEAGTESSELDSSVSSKIPVVDDVVDVGESVGDGVGDVVDATADVATDGTGLVGDALTDAYVAAADKVAFVANTVITTVEQAVAILLGGFDFSAGCPHWTWPTLDVSNTGISVGFGRQSCEVVLVGQRLTLFDFNWGTLTVNYPQPIAAMVALGSNLVNCISGGGPAFDVFKCVAVSIGETLLQVVPPFSILTQLSRMLSEFLAFFAQLASTAITAALDDTTSLVQEAVKVSAFPTSGQPPRLVNSRRGVSAHIRRHESLRRVPKKADAFVQTNASVHAREEPDDTMATGALGFATTEAMPYASMLITQFGGDEFDSGSCLGFAPKHRTGADGKVTKRDWQVPSPDSHDFVKLEPWAVPCDNQWAKDNPDKWEGYSFYTYESVIEKCVAISYSMSVQPTLAFVGGLEFDLMPAPLAEVTTEVCWPDRVSAPDLSLIVMTIRTGGIVLFKHTIRLHKRFGSDTGFTSANIKDAVERARNYFGKGTASDDDKSLQGMSRTALNQVENSTDRNSKESEEVLFHPQQEELYLASAKYDAQLGVNITQRFSGQEATARVRAAMRPRQLGALQEAEEEQGLGKHELFELSSPSASLVGFSVIGELESGVMQLKIQMKFGPIPSPEKTIPLLNVVDHLRIVLAAIPFMSQASKQKAVDAFSTTDLEPYIPPTHVIGPLPLASGWSDWGHGYSSPTYILRDGICSVQALVNGPGHGRIATLPTECRPSGGLVFNVNRGSSMARVNVNTDGSVMWHGGGSGSSWLSLSNILFTPHGGWPLELVNGWKNKGSDWAPATYRVIGGLCILSGLIKDGSWSQFGILPEECRPQKRLIFNMNNEDATMRVDVGTDGWVGYVGGSKTHHFASLSGIIFSTDPEQTLPLKLGSTGIVWNYGGDYRSTTYSLIEGICILEGLISYSSMVENQVLAYLPVECWPMRDLSFTMNQGADAPRVQVYANGEVRHVSGARSTQYWLSLSGIAFSPAPGGRRKLPYMGGWSDYGWDFGMVSFSIKNGLCILEGLVYGGDWAQWFAELPEGCRPTKKLVFHANNNAGSARVDVTTGGGVMYMAGPNNHHWVSLAGIAFAPDTVGHIALPLAGSWVAWGSEYASPDYTVRNGICSVEGLIKGGAWGDLANLPEDCRPPDGRLIFNTNNGVQPSRVDVDTDGKIKWVAGGQSKGWISLSGIVFSPTVVGYPIPLQNGWSNYGNGYAPAKYRVVDGICMLEGLINKGSDNHAATLPADCRPNKKLVFDANKHGSIDRLDVDIYGHIFLFNLNAGDWASLSGVLFDVE